MDLNKQYIQKRIKLTKRRRISVTENPGSLQQRMSSSFSEAIPPIQNSDYYIPLMLTRTSEVYEYVDVKKDEKIVKIERQEVNPYFMELGFFDDLARVKINAGSNLTQKMIEYISEKINGIEVLATYPLDRIETIFNEPSSQYNGYTGLIIGGGRPEPIELPVFSKILIEGGTPYDGIYTPALSPWIDTNGNVGGFFCTPFRVLDIGANFDNPPWLVYRKSGITMKLIQVLFNNESELRDWFDYVGYNQLVKETDPDTGEPVLITMDKLQVLWNNLISKAAAYNIAINS